MAIRRLATVIDRDGVSGRLHQVTLDASDKPVARIRLSDGSHVNVPFELLQHEESGGYKLPASWRDFRGRGDAGITIPIVEEKVHVDVRPAPERRLRVRRRVLSRLELVETPMMQERIEVERVPIDRVVDKMPRARQEGDVLIIPTVEEEVVVQRRLRVRDELRIRVVREQRIHRETIELRRHELEINSTEPPIPFNKRRGD